jgi:hypothetical protein
MFAPGNFSPLEWSPSDTGRRSRQRIAPSLLAEENSSSPRRFNRTISKKSRLSWSWEKLVLVVAFVGALAFGYFASTLLWRPDLLGARTLALDA